MIKHNGFHLGNYATWDPRSDVLLIYKKEIERGESNFSIPLFNNLVMHHELTHRYFYKVPGIVGIVEHSNYFNSLLTKPDELAKFDKIKFLRSMIRHYFSYIADVGMVLDAFHTFILLREYIDLNKHNIQDLGRYFAVILDDKSKRIFDNIFWFSKNIESWKKIILKSMSFAMMPGYSHFLRSKADPMTCPSEILLDILDTIRAIYESNPEKIKSINENFTKYVRSQQEYLSRYKKILTELSKYNPYLQNYALMKFDMKEYVEIERKSIPYSLLGKNFLSMQYSDVMHQECSVKIFKESDGRYSVQHRSDVRKKTFNRLLFNLTISHFQDCIFHGAELECFMCEIGFCSPEFADVVHKNIKKINHIVYN